jgi:hypothetical protein
MKGLLRFLAPVACVVGVLPVGAARAADTASLNISITTMHMSMLGMPANLPNIPGMPNLNQARKTLMVTLTSPDKAPDGATAALDVPAGLGVGQTVDLALSRPGAMTGGRGPDMSHAKLDIYWGCGDTIGDGQPKSGPMNDVMRRFIQSTGLRMNMRLDSTLASWPTGRTMMSGLGADASAVGDYALHTSYCGNATFSVAANEDFLAPIDLLSPTGMPDLDTAISLSWKSVPNAVGYQVLATGSKPAATGEPQTMIMWFGSRNSPMDAMANGKGLEGWLLPADATSCTIPAGIFKGTMGGAIMVSAVGKSQSVDGNPSVRITCISTAMTMMGGFGGRRPN